MNKQTKPYIWTLLVIAIFLIGLVGGKMIFSSSSSTSSTQSASDAELTISEENWDFGDIPMSKGVVTKSISLRNDTSTPLTVTNMETSCMCTSVQIVHADGSKSGKKGMVGHGGGSSDLSETIEAAEEATLLVTFDPNAHGPTGTGPITRDVMLKTNSKTQSDIDLTFSGNVIK